MSNTNNSVGAGSPSECAPVVLFVYNRPDHAQSTLDALLENSLASETDLFVFSDGSKNEGDEQGVADVRALLRNLTGFKSVRITESATNKGLAASIIDGVTEIVNDYGRVIVLEDDLVTHPDTLSYFNASLDHFADHQGVFSISGYSHPATVMPVSDRYEYDVYAIPRMQCWGWATWKDRWSKADFDMTDFDVFSASHTQTKAFSYWVGGDALMTLRQYMAGERDVWACRWVYAHYKHHAVCICPTVSLVDNIGLDGSGSNCGPRDDLKNELNVRFTEAWRFPSSAFIDPEIFEAFMRVTDPTWNRVVHQSSGLPLDRPLGPSTLDRVQFWGRNPKKLVKRLFEIGQKRFIKLIGGRPPKTSLELSHKRFEASPTVPLTRLGTQYGGWCVPNTGLGPDDVVVSAGAGEDISFDLEIVKRFGCKVLVLDPTPRAIHHFQETKKAISNGARAAINGSPTEFYDYL